MNEKLIAWLHELSHVPANRIEYLMNVRTLQVATPEEHAELERILNHMPGRANAIAEAMP